MVQACNTYNEYIHLAFSKNFPIMVDLGCYMQKFGRKKAQHVPRTPHAAAHDHAP
jgi:hypothetical protein